MSAKLCCHFVISRTDNSLVLLYTLTTQVAVEYWLQTITMSSQGFENDPVLVSILDSYLTDNDKRQPSVIRALHCRLCGSRPITCVVAKECRPGVCLLLECREKSRMVEGKKQGCPKWYFCTNCKCRITGTKQRILSHLCSSMHQSSVPQAGNGQDQELQPDVPPNNDNISNSGNDYDLSPMEDADPPDDDVDHDDYMNDYAFLVDANMSSSTPNDEEENQLSTISETNACKPKISWIEKPFLNIPIATIMDVIQTFDSLDGKLRELMFFFVAEHTSSNGGVRYLVSRAFKKTEYLFSGQPTGEEIASIEESIWHFQSFVQYMSMNTRQKIRQSEITKPFSPTNSQFFRVTRPLTYNELNRFYGRSNKHCLWNTLPVPPVRNIDGIAYVNPVHALQYLMAFGLEVDNILSGDGYDDAKSTISSMDAQDISPTKKIYYLEESAAAAEMRHQAITSPEFKQALLETGATEALLLWMVDWRDGFGSNRTKQNRKSTVAWTISLSTPKDRVNSISNTIPIAVGLKKNGSWHKVEHQFREDMLVFADGKKPVMVYRGDIKKVVPVFVKRIACLTDKVERSDYTSTLHCVSTMHRKFGTIIHLQKPKYKSTQIDSYLKKQKDGRDDRNLKQFGWSSKFIDNRAGANGGKFPACNACRRQNIIDILNGNNDIRPACSQCANWTLDDSTKDLLEFDAPKDYPQVVFFENSPVNPPAGREVGLKKLKLLKLDYEIIVQAIRFAFYQSKGGRGSSWTKATCCAYLRTCGVNKKQQDLVYSAAKLAHQQGIEVNYLDPLRLGSYRFAAAYCGDLALTRFIETLMHLLFLGVTEALFKLFNAQYSKFAGKGQESFKKKTQPLLKALAPFNLSWLLILQFSGKPEKLTTGSWVSENWLAFVRIFKVAYCFFGKDGIVDERNGSADLYRVVIAFPALVARLLSHSGTNESIIHEIGLYIKEFLSAVDEVDIRVRHKELNKDVSSTNDAGFGGKEKDHEQMWMKSNFMSLLNLVDTIRLLGPLINLWDGGGKGERYIQEIKPHIPRGVRDGGRFFERLLQKIYKVHCIRLIEGAWYAMEIEDEDDIDEEISSAGSRSDVDDSDKVDDDDDSVVSSKSSESVIAGSTSDNVSYSSEQSGSESSPENTDTDSENSTVSSLLQDGDDSTSPVELEQMKKSRTVYIYKSRAQLDESFNTRLPVSGIIVSGNDNKFEFMVLFKTQRGKCGWSRIVFDDDNGAKHCGMWYAPMTMIEASIPPPKSISQAKKHAQMSAVAIPFHFIVGDNHADSNKYCVITNWWRERNPKGYYVLPALDPNLYPMQS